MSYDKLKSLVANVEAIETAMKIKVQGRTATQEEKAVLSRYSGFGGIKEVLNIGTDRPIGGNMDEPVRRLQELIDAYPYFSEPMRQAVTESIKASVLTAFYTPKSLSMRWQGRYTPRSDKTVCKCARFSNRPQELAVSCP